MNVIEMSNNIIVKNIKLILSELVVVFLLWLLYVMVHKNLILVVIGLSIAFFYFVFNNSAYQIVNGNDVGIKKLLKSCKKNVVKFIFVAIMFIVCFFSLVICSVLILMNIKGLGLVLAVPLILFVIIAVHITMMELCINQNNIVSVLTSVSNKFKKNIIVCLLYSIMYVVTIGIGYGVYILVGISVAVVVATVLMLYVNLMFSVVYFRI